MEIKIVRRNQYPARQWDKEKKLLSCSKCSSLLPYSSFSPDKASSSGYGYWCKQCAAANSRLYHKLKRANNLLYKKARREQYIKRKYGISLQEYIEKLAQQKYLCAICGVKLPTNGQLTHPDHDHKTGKLRDFLCTNCNRGLGHFMDSSLILDKASNYLNTHNSNVDTIKEVKINESSH